MNFGLEDMRNNTILGTPTQELSSLAEELKKTLENSVEESEKQSEPNNV